MSKSKRLAVRTELKAAVKLSQENAEDLNLTTADISDTGAYIVTGDNVKPQVGDIVTLQVQGMGGGEAPVLRVRVVRLGKEGIGVEFIND